MADTKAAKNEEETVPVMDQRPTESLVLATDVVDQDDNGNQVVVAREGDSLPASLKDNEDAYIENGVLVPESYQAVMNNPRMKAAMSGAMGLHDVVQLTKEQVGQLKEVAETMPEPPALQA